MPDLNKMRSVMNRIPRPCVTFTVAIVTVVILNLMRNPNPSLLSIFTGAILAATGLLSLLYIAIQPEPDANDYFKFCLALTSVSIGVAITLILTDAIDIETALYFICQNSGIISAAIFMMCVHRLERK